MKIIGITGQTGAGKSIVCEEFEKLGYYHIDADLVAKEVIDSNEKVKKALALQFGEDVILPDGKIDRRELVARAFKTKKSAEKLSEITHPAVIDEIKNIIEGKKADSACEGVLVDAIGLFESGAADLCDFSVCVTAPEEIRLQRIVERDRISVSAALLRIRAQKDESFFVSRADYTVCNDGKHQLSGQIKRILAYEQG